MHAAPYSPLPIRPSPFPQPDSTSAKTSAANDESKTNNKACIQLPVSVRGVEYSSDWVSRRKEKGFKRDFELCERTASSDARRNFVPDKGKSTTVPKKRQHHKKLFLFFPSPLLPFHLSFLVPACFLYLFIFVFVQPSFLPSFPYFL